MRSSRRHARRGVVIRLGIGIGCGLTLILSVAATIGSASQGFIEQRLLCRTLACDARRQLQPLVTQLNGALFGEPDAGLDMTFNFFELIAHAAKTRPLGAGCIIGSGTVSNYDRSRGSSCLAERRMLEIIESGQATTPFLCFGDTVSIAMQDRNGMSLFGTILQRVTQGGASQTS